MPVNSTTQTNQQNAINLLLSQVDPQLAADQGTYAAYNAQLQALPAQTQQADTYQQTMAGYQLGQQGISGQQIGLQGQGLALQNQLAQQQQGIETQQFGLQQGLAGMQAGSAMQNLQGSLAASGALNTVGSQREQTQQFATAETQNQLANLGQQSELAGYAAQQGGTAGGVNYGGGQAGIAQQNLSLMAQANGLSEQQTLEQLNYGLAQNKQSGIQSANQLLSQMGSLAAGDITTAGAASAPIGYSAGINQLAGNVG